MYRYPVPPNADTKGFTDNYIGSWLHSQKRENVVLASKVSPNSVRQPVFGEHRNQVSLSVISCL